MNRLAIWILAISSTACNPPSVSQGGHNSPVLPSGPFANSNHPRVHEKVFTSGVVFEVWREGDKIAANKYSTLNGKVWQAYRFDGKKGFFYQYDHELTTCEVKPSVTGENFSQVHFRERIPNIDSIDNLANAEKILLDPKVSKKPDRNRATMVESRVPFFMFAYEFDRLGRITDIRRGDTNAMIQFSFDYPDKIDPKIFEFKALPNVKVIKSN